MVNKITSIDFNDIYSAYLSGVGVSGIAKMLGVSPRPIQRILRENGIELRGRSEQQAARMARATPSERKKLAAKAHAAVRGRKRSVEELEQRAKTRQIRLTHRSEAEDRLAEQFRALGYKVGQQTAIGVYNADLTIDAVAVEVLGGEWHRTPQRARRLCKRLPYFADRGWSTLFIEGRPNLEDLVALLDELRGLPPGVRQYRVIWGAREFITGGSPYDDHITFEPPFTATRCRITGRYKRIAR